MLRHEQENYIKMGFDSYVPKPFKYNEILEVLEISLDIEFNYKSPQVKKQLRKLLMN